MAAAPAELDPLEPEPDDELFESADPLDPDPFEPDEDDELDDSDELFEPESDVAESEEPDAEELEDGLRLSVL